MVERHSHNRIIIFKPSRLLTVDKSVDAGKLSIDFKAALFRE